MSREEIKEWVFKRHTLEEIEEMPVLRQGQFDNLLFEGEGHRLWHSRMTVADGMPYDNQVSVECYFPEQGRWAVVSKYKPISEKMLGK